MGKEGYTVHLLVSAIRKFFIFGGKSLNDSRDFGVHLRK